MHKYFILFLSFFIITTNASEQKKLNGVFGFNFGDKYVQEYLSANQDKYGLTYEVEPDRNQVLEYNEYYLSTTIKTNKIYSIIAIKNPSDCPSEQSLELKRLSSLYNGKIVSPITISQNDNNIDIMCIDNILVTHFYSPELDLLAEKEYRDKYNLKFMNGAFGFEFGKKLEDYSLIKNSHNVSKKSMNELNEKNNYLVEPIIKKDETSTSYFLEINPKTKLISDIKEKTLMPLEKCLDTREKILNIAKIDYKLSDDNNFLLNMMGIKAISDENKMILIFCAKKSMVIQYTDKSLKEKHLINNQFINPF